MLCLNAFEARRRGEFVLGIFCACVAYLCGKILIVFTCEACLCGGVSIVIDILPVRSACVANFLF